LERQVRDAQETVKQMRRMAPSSIHDAACKHLAAHSKDVEEIVATGVVDKSVPVRVRVPSDLCASKVACGFDDWLSLVLRSHMRHCQGGQAPRQEVWLVKGTAFMCGA